MKEREFLSLLEKRANEQERLIKQMPFQRIFVLASLWFGSHPWRLLIPLSLLLTLLFRLILGYRYYELVLKIFGGFGILQ
jgi:hypothetical protein